MSIGTHANVAISEKADQLGAIIHHGDATAAVFPHELGGATQRVVCTTRHNITFHRLFDMHRKPSGCLIECYERFDDAVEFLIHN